MSVIPQPTTGLSKPLFYMGDSSLPDKSRPPGPAEVVSTSWPLRPETHSDTKQAAPFRSKKRGSRSSRGEEPCWEGHQQRREE